MRRMPAMKDEIKTAQRIITALDVGDKDQALLLVSKLEDAEIFKVGLQLFTSEGPALLSTIRDCDKNVFLDLKLHDIPNTVGEAVKVCVSYGVKMMTLHASGGREMMTRAADAAGEEAEKIGVDKPWLLGVTVLTSLKDEQIIEIGMKENALGQVKRLARLAREAGLDGVVCSPQEISEVRSETGKDFLIVAPGIRPSWAAAHDQKRIMTPVEAVKKGADFLVIGRPIIKDKNPLLAFQKIVEEIETQ
jgi:orotidine-5'-phosphate decarboxylase